MSNYKHFILIGLFAFMANHSKAQVDPPTLLPGLGAIYSNNLDAVGFNVRLYYGLDHHYCFGPEVSYIKKSTDEEEESLFEANANLHYILDLEHGFGFYPIIGLNYTLETETEFHNTFTSEHQDDVFGLNIGAGFHYEIEKFLFFLEYKYVVSTLSDHFITAGIYYNFSLSKSKEKEHHN